MFFIENIKERDVIYGINPSFTIPLSDDDLIIVHNSTDMERPVWTGIKGDKSVLFTDPNFHEPSFINYLFKNTIFIYTVFTVENRGVFLVFRRRSPNPLETFTDNLGGYLFI